MSHVITDILFRSDAFFEKTVAEKDASLKKSLFIVLAGAFSSAVFGNVYGGPSMKMMSALVPAEIASLMDIIGIAGILITVLITTLLFWLVFTGVFYILSGFFKGTGSFRQCLRITGYGFFPQIFGALISLIAALVYIPRVIVPQISQAATQDPQMIQDTFKALMHDPAMMELTQVTSLISIVFLLWSANIWIFGIKHARNLTPRDAALSVGIPVIAYVLYITYNLGVM
jgi:hypothetical protein